MLQDLAFDLEPGLSDRSIRAASFLRWLSGLMAALTMATVPWFLGGAIPQAKLVLLLGAVFASAAALTARLICGDFKVRLSYTSLPLLGYCLISIVQLMPIQAYPAVQMQHAVAGEDVVRWPASTFADFRKPMFPRTVLPAETRQGLAQSLSLTLLVLVLADVVKSSQDVRHILGMLTLSGTAMAALAMSQQFGVVDVVLGNHWKVSPTVPFGCFVNPNNAAGWLIVCLAAAMYLAGCSFQSSRHSSLQASSQWISWGDRVWYAWSDLVGRIAEMTTGQILSVSAVILLIAGIATTLSRAGITAALLGLVAYFMSRVFTGRWFAASCSLVVILVGSVLFLSLMDLDTVVLSELETLKDPVSESTGRLLHWSDSLRSCLDFPLIGSGVSAYRCASMPYQHHHTGKWFQRADNQYVEVLVESGLLGFACFAGLGILGLMLAIRTLMSRSHHPEPEAISANWLASSVVLGITALSGAAFFDYGVSLSSVASAIVALVTLLENRFLASGKPGHGIKSSGWLGIDRVRSSVFLLWLSLIGSTVAFVPDTLAAAQAYSAVAAAERLLAKSAVEALDESGDLLLSGLNAAMEKRPDDYLTARTRFLLLEQLCRRELLSLISKGQAFDQQALQTRFQSMKPGALAFQWQNLALPKEIAIQAREEFLSCLKKYDWGEAGRNLMMHSVGLPSLGLLMMEYGVIFSDQACQKEATRYLQFSEPHDAPGLFEIGLLMLRDGRMDEAKVVWKQSLSVSEQFRPRMISELAEISSIEQSLTWLMPDRYESCVQCAIEMRSEPVLREQLLKQAENIWVANPPRITDSVAISRSRQLEEMGSVEAGLNVLELYLFETPDNLLVRKAMAALLERVGRNGDAYDEWLRIQSFHPDEPAVSTSLERLIKLPPTSER